MPFTTSNPWLLKIVCALSHGDKAKVNENYLFLNFAIVVVGRARPILSLLEAVEGEDLFLFKEF